jgi:hypothetical protein
MTFSEFLKKLARYCRTKTEATSDFVYAVLESAVQMEIEISRPDKSTLEKIFNGSRQLTGKVARMMLTSETINKAGFIEFMEGRISSDVIDEAKEAFGFERDLDVDEFYEKVFLMLIGHLTDVANRDTKGKASASLPIEDTESSSSLYTSPVVTESRPLQPSNFFRGREKQLEIIKERLSGTGKLMLLNGMGGIGKTEICRKLFHDAMNGRLPEVKKIGWLTYSGSLEQTYFRQFLPLEKPASKAVEYKKQAEAYINSLGGEFLLFIDNANEIPEKETAQLLKLNCKVLMTSRRRTMGRLHAFEIGKLEMDDCRILYRQHFNMKSFDKNSDSNYNTSYAENAAPDDDLDAIIHMADRHTLAIELLAKQQSASLLIVWI